MNSEIEVALPYKKKLCSNFTKGSCIAGQDCTFAHGQRELRSFENPIYKSMLCTSYEQGGICQMGNDCLLAHGEGELRADDVVTSMGGASQDENVPPVGAKGGQTGQTKKGQYKSALCIHFVKHGSCNMDTNCQFAHGKEELTNTSPPDTNDPKYKTKLCIPFEQENFCPNGDYCVFAHGNGELKSLPEDDKKGKAAALYKTSLCNNFINLGLCPSGKNCSFAHGKYELRPIGFDGDFEAKISENPKWKCLMCNIYVQTGHCNRVNCDFAHGEQELRNEYPDNTKPMKVNYKTVLCNNFKSRGYCFHEDACNFAHGDQELNTIKDAASTLKLMRDGSALRKRPKTSEGAGVYGRLGGGAVGATGVTSAAESSSADQKLFAEFLAFKKFKQQSDSAVAAAPPAPTPAQYYNSTPQSAMNSTISSYYTSILPGPTEVSNHQSQNQGLYHAGGFRKLTQTAPATQNPNNQNGFMERQRLQFRGQQAQQPEFAY